MLRHRILTTMALAAFAASAAFAQSPGQPQGPARPVTPAQTAPTIAFRATHYEIRASLDATAQTLSATAKVEFAAILPSRSVEVELNPNLKVTAVTDAAGRQLAFERDAKTPHLLRATLNEPAASSSRVALTFAYSGPLSSRPGNISGAIPLAYIGADSAYLLLESRWFPLTDFPANRFTGVFQIEVPGEMTVVGTGTMAQPETLSWKPAPAPAGANPGTPPGVISPRGAPAPPVPDRVLYTYRVDQPESAGTFVAGPLQMSAVQAQGQSFKVYSPAAAVKSAQSYGDALARILDYYNSQFGPLPREMENLTVAQLPDGTVSGYAAPGLLLVSARNWSDPPNARLLANLAAQQWWGAQVSAASPSDAWITDGLARYCEGLYVEQTSGREALNKALEDFAVGALMYEDAAPIAEAARLEPGSQEYRSVVVNKGAMVFHMLRGQLGDDRFFALLHDFFAKYQGKAARITDFEDLAVASAALAPTTPVKTAISDGVPPATAAPPASGANLMSPASGATGAAAAPAVQTPAVPLNLRPFFAQWLHSTGVPEFNLDFVVYRTKDGFKIVGKVKQNLDFFRMPVDVEVQTEGNPEFKTIQVAGTSSDFEIDTFGRPKPNGIILDPHDYILKSSPALRVRAIIARGESLAEQGRYYDAVQQYQQALSVSPMNALADFRMGEAFFYQKNYSVSAQSFRDCLDAVVDPTTNWTTVWSHIYLGKIYDISGDRARAVNEYSKAKQTGDNTGSAQDEAEKLLRKAYTEGAT